MKLLLINTLYPPNVVGGAERSVQMLAERLSTGDSVIVATLTPHRSDHVAVVNGVGVHYLAIRNLYWPFSESLGRKLTKPVWHLFDAYNPWMERRLSALIDGESPDVVHTNNISGFSVSAWRGAARRRLPIIHTIRDYYLLCPRTTMYRRGANCQQLCRACSLYSVPKKAASSVVNTVVGVSNFVLSKHLAEGFFPNASRRLVIPNAYAVRTRKTSTPREREVLHLGYLGRVSPEKGIEVLLETAMRLSPENYVVSVGGVGRVAYRRYLEEKFSAPHINFLGWVDTEKFFEEVDVLVVPTLWQEPFGRTVIEAWGHGVPVVASNRGSLAEIGKDGSLLFFDPESADSLHKVIEKVLTDDTALDRLRRRGQARVEHFGLDEVVERYRAVYREAVAAYK